MLDPIPEKVKNCLLELTPSQQVTVRAYIGTLRADLKDIDKEILDLKNKTVEEEKKCDDDVGENTKKPKEPSTPTKTCGDSSCGGCGTKRKEVSPPTEPAPPPKKESKCGSKSCGGCDKDK